MALWITAATLATRLGPRLNHLLGLPLEKRHDRQRIKIDKATAGTFTLAFDNGTSIQTTAALAYDITAAQLKIDLELLSTVNGVSVFKDPDGGFWDVTFLGTLANAKQVLMTADGTLLTGTDGPYVETEKLHDGFDDVVSTAVLADVVTGANGEVDAYLQARYTLADVLTHGVPVAAAQDIAVYRLVQIRPEAGAPDGADYVAYTNALTSLRKVENGELALAAPRPNLQTKEEKAEVVDLGADLVQTDTVLMTHQDWFAGV